MKKSNFCKLLFFSRIYVVVLVFFIAGCQGNGNSDKEQPDNRLLPVEKISLLSGLPVKTIAGSTVLAVIEIKNTSMDRQVIPVSVATLSENFQGPPGTVVNLNFDKVTRVGPGGTCSNGVLWAVLQSGQECLQKVGIHIPVAGEFSMSVEVTLVMRTLGYEKKVHETFMLQTVSVERSDFQSENSMHVGSPLSFRPNTTTTIPISNTSPLDSPDNEIQGGYIDFSGIPESLLESIDKSSIENGVYDEEHKRIIVDDIPAGETLDVSFFVDGGAQTSLQNTETQASLEDNMNAPLIQVGAANVQEEVPPAVIVFADPFHAEQSEPGGDIVVSVPKNGAAIIYDRETDFSHLQEKGIVITPVIKTEDGMLNPGDSMTFAVSLQPDAVPGKHTFTVRFYDESGYVYERDFSIDVDNTTTLGVEGDFYVYTKHKDAVTEEYWPLKVTNTGHFNAQFPTDLSEQFSVSGGGLVTSEVFTPTLSTAYGSQVLPSCSSHLLPPKESCIVNLLSTDPNAVADSYGIYIIARNNLKSQRLSTVVLQPSPYDFRVSLDNVFPSLIKAGEAAILEMKILNQGQALNVDDISIENNSIPEEDAVWSHLSVLKNGETIAEGSKDNPEVHTLRYEVKGKKGANISSSTHIKFNGGRVSFTSNAFTGRFVDEEDLPESIAVENSVRVSAGSDFEITITNKNKTSRMQNVVLDLSGLSPELRQAITLEAQEGVRYDPQTGEVIFEHDLLEESSKTLIFHFPLTEENHDLFEQEKTKFATNDVSENPAVRITSNGSKTVAPKFEVSETVLSFPPETLNQNFSSPESLEHSFQNTTDQPLSVTKITTTDPHLTATLDTQTIQSGDSANLTVGTENGVAPGHHEVTMQLEDREHHPFTDILNVEIPPVTLEVPEPVEDREVNVYQASEGQNSVTNVALLNENPEGAGYAVYGVNDIGKAFEVRDSEGNVVGEDQILVVEGTVGSSLKSGVDYGHQAVIGLEIQESPQPVLEGDFSLYTTEEAGNLAAGQKLTDFEVRPAPNYLALAEQGKIPDKVLAGKTFTWQSTLSNIAPENMQIELLEASLVDTSVEPHVKMPLKTGSTLWDGTASQILNSGDHVNLSFDKVLATEPDKFTGYVEVRFRQGNTEYTQNVQHFATEVAEDSHDVLYLNHDNLLEKEDLLQVEPDGMTNMEIHAGTQGLNNLELDLSGLAGIPELYNEIQSITFQGVPLDISASKEPGIIGSLLADKKATISIRWKGSAEAVMRRHYQAFIDNPVTKLIGIGAANTKMEYPIILVLVQPLVPEDGRQVLLENTQPVHIRFKNSTHSAMVLTSLDNGGLAADGISVSGGTCLPSLPNTNILPGTGNATCYIALTASEDAEWIKTDENRQITLHYQDTAGNTFDHLKTTVTTVGVNVHFTGSTVLHRPHSGMTEIAYTITLVNEGPFKLKAKTGTLSGLLSEPTKPGGMPHLASGSCDSLVSLAVNASCTFKINVYDTDTEGANGSIAFTRGTTNLAKEKEIFNYSIGQTIGRVEARENGRVVDNTETNKITMTAESGKIIYLTVKNIGEQPLELPVTAPGFVYGDNSALETPIVGGNCYGGSKRKSLISGQDCTVTLTGKNWSSPDTVSHDGEIIIQYIIGNGDTREYPVKVTVKPIPGWLNVSYGGSHKCAISRLHKLYCGGSSLYGQTGHSNGYDFAAVDTTLDFSEVSTGSDYTCAISYPEGRLFCWGYNYKGELGNGTVGVNSSRPVEVTVPGVASFTKVSCGRYHACAISDAGKVYCWGWNASGQLGNGTRIDSSKPVKVHGFDNMIVDRISASFLSHSCAIASNNLYCWGDNVYSELGSAAAGLASETPVRSASPLQFKEVSAGAYFTCAIAIDGKVYCWGYQRANQGVLDHGRTDSFQTASPVNVLNISSASKISCGSNHCCAVISNGEQYCWGENGSHSLGVSSTIAFSATPIQSSDVQTAEKTAAGYYQNTCIITTVQDGSRLYCWNYMGKQEIRIPSQ